MAGRPPYSGGRDGEARPNERQGQQSGSNPGQHPPQQNQNVTLYHQQQQQQQHQIDPNQLPSHTHQQMQGSFQRTSSSQSVFGPYQPPLPIQGSASPAMSANTQPTVFAPASSAPAFPVRPGEPDCQFYLRTGDCKFSSSCRFNHPVGGTPRESSLSSQFMVQTHQQTYVGGSSHQPYSGPVCRMPPPTVVVDVPPVSQPGYQQAVPPIFGNPRLPTWYGAYEVGDSSSLVSNLRQQPSSGRLYRIPTSLLVNAPRASQPGYQQVMPSIPNFRNIRVPLYDTYEVQEEDEHEGERNAKRVRK